MLTKGWRNPKGWGAHLHLQVLEAGDGVVVLGGCLLHLALTVQLIALLVDQGDGLQLLLIRHGPGVLLVGARLLHLHAHGQRLRWGTAHQHLDPRAPLTLSTSMSKMRGWGFFCSSSRSG